MKRIDARQGALAVIVAAALTALAGCGPQKAPVVIAPPPPPIIIPLRPYPPMGASPLLAVPPVDINGVRHTVNTGISPAQTVWNLRSAYNVAALNCLQPQHAPILAGYRNFLKTHSRALTAANRSVDSEFRSKYGSRYIPPRETYMTQVYNFYALPPTVSAFCDAALTMSLEGAAIKSAELTDFAARSLPKIDVVFENFYRSYEQYRADLAAWEARYGALATAQPATAFGQNMAQ